MIDFPITELLDASMCMIWLVRHLHPDGFACPHCGSTKRRLFRQQRFPAYRCRACDGYYTLLTGTAFEKTRQQPSTVVLLLRGITKGESTARLAREFIRFLMLSFAARSRRLMRHSLGGSKRSASGRTTLQKTLRT